MFELPRIPELEAIMETGGVAAIDQAAMCAIIQFYLTNSSYTQMKTCGVPTAVEPYRPVEGGPTAFMVRLEAPGILTGVKEWNSIDDLGD